MTGMNEFRMAKINEPPKKWYLHDGLMSVWAVLLMALLIFVAQNFGANVGAMPTRLEPQGVAEWMMNEGAGAGREVQVVSKVLGIPPGITVEACNDAVLSGKRQGTTIPSQERTYYYNGIATPQETAMEKCKLKRMRVAANTKRLGTSYNTTTG